MIKLAYFSAILTAMPLACCASSQTFPDLYNGAVKADDVIVVSESSRRNLVNDLSKRRAIWSQNEPHHYKYIIVYSTYFVCDPTCGPNEVEIKGGKIIDVRFLGRKNSGVKKGAKLPKKYWSVLSIDKQLNLVAGFAEEAKLIDPISDDEFDQTWVYIEYDSMIGFPTLIRRNDPSDNHGDHSTYIGYFEIIEN